MRRLLVILVFIIVIGVNVSQAYAGYDWQKAGTLSNAVIYASPNYEQDKSLYALADKDLYRSMDEGKTWDKISTMPVLYVQTAYDKSLYALQGINEKELAIYKYHLSPGNWEKICDAPTSTKVFAVLPNGSIILSKSYESSSYLQILKRKVNGNVWEDMAYNHGGQVFSPTPDGTVFTTEKETNFGSRGTDFGASWKMLNKYNLFNNFFVSPNYLADKTIFSIINNSVISQSTDQGDNWFTKMNGIEGNTRLTSMAFSYNYANDKIVYAADDKGHVYVSRNGAVDWTGLDLELPKNIGLKNIVVLPDSKILAGTTGGVYEVYNAAFTYNNSLRTQKAKFKIGQMTYKINNDVWYMDAAPYTENDRTFVPVRFLAYSLGLNDSNILWDNNKKEVTLTKGNTVTKLALGYKVLFVNNNPVMMDVLPEMSQGRIMLPARWVAEAFGSKVTWDDSEQAVVIEYSETK